MSDDMKKAAQGLVAKLTALDLNVAEQQLLDAVFFAAIRGDVDRFSSPGRAADERPGVYGKYLRRLTGDDPFPLTGDDPFPLTGDDPFPAR